jgi:hypothetical protein
MSRSTPCVGACADIEGTFTSGWSATLQSLGCERGPLEMAGAPGAHEGLPLQPVVPARPTGKHPRATGWVSSAVGFDRQASGPRLAERDAHRAAARRLSETPVLRAPEHRRHSGRTRPPAHRRRRGRAVVLRALTTEPHRRPEPARLDPVRREGAASRPWTATAESMRPGRRYLPTCRVVCQRWADARSGCARRMRGSRAPALPHRARRPQTGRRRPRPRVRRSRRSGTAAQAQVPNPRPSGPAARRARRPTRGRPR